MSDPQLSHDAITADYRIYQRRRGHRYSLDDLATAWEAAHAVEAPSRCIDIGCGIGSVLLMLAWRFPQAAMTGIEALPMSLALARKNVVSNGLSERVTLIEGDLREVARSWDGPRAELVTGTPPYLPEGTALPSPDPQRTAARIELRGGIEAYLLAAAQLVAPKGRVVVCAGGRHPERVLAGAAAADLRILRRRDIYARQGQPHPLFAVWTLAPQNQPPETSAARDEPQAEGDGAYQHLALYARDGEGRRTTASNALRQTFGL